MMKVKLKDLGKIITGNTPSKHISEFYNSEDIGFVKPDIISEQQIDYIENTTEYLAEAARKKARIVKKNAVFVTCIGSIGKIGIVKSKELAFNQQINAIEPNEKVLPQYLAYGIFANKRRLQAISNAPVVPIINKTQFGEFEIDIINDTKEQLKIVKLLDKVYEIIANRKEELEKLDELIKARFVEMFGDMFLNTMAWNEQPLESMADVVSGITKGRKIKEQCMIKVPYMAVSNVKDGYIDWTTIKTIEATKQEIEQYRLLPDDVLMTEGGDPDKLGRGAIIKEPLENCIHQNHIFRVRLNESVILPGFFVEYLKHQKAKRYFLGCAKQTTGIASINMRQLKALPVLLPPMELQKKFLSFVEQIEKSKVAAQKALEETQLLFDSLMQKYFS